ncbi:MAG: 10-Formyltetrahydrofolate:L-methionyl-tRNA N-formyltransferase [Firmicutes bacterium]|nr:10-Formyltetrahydrofolate:L-methionyl-tRNA N-formyltransferase [Bacillota bacterium]
MLKVLFMGTPEFAAQCLEAVLAAGYPVVGVVTQPDKPVGRGGKVRFSAVKELALKHDLPVFQPKRVRRPEVIAQLKELGADITVVVAYGQILSAEALAISPRGSLNVHGSLLPRWRGAAPIHRAVMAGDAETGITTMWMDEGMDTGDMILKAATPIGPEETSGEIHDRLARIGADLLVETLRQVAAGTAPRSPQPADGVTYAAKLERADEVIDWSRPAVAIANQVRGLNPWPVAYTTGPKGTLKLWKASVYTGAVEPRHQGPPDQAPPGTVVALVKKQGFVVATGDGQLLVREVQPPGKGRMDAQSYINGGNLMAGANLQ